MNNSELEIKLEFIEGLKGVVLAEIKQYAQLRVTEKEQSVIYLEFIEAFQLLERFRSVLKVFIVAQNSKYNPLYISKHKSIIGNIIALVTKSSNNFKTFKIICAGSNSPEVRALAEYVQNTHKLTESNDADLKIHIVKNNNIWEVGVQITSRPLSVRDYKLVNMGGAMDPTIAYALNSLCELGKATSYLNVFSGSATLLIEAGQCYPDLKQLIGFDNDKESLSLAMKNIKKAGLIKKIKLKEKDIFDNPSLGNFDVITSDLPFGMLVSRHEDLEKLYQAFIDYAQKVLNQGGTLGVYTSKGDLFRKIIRGSDFKIIKQVKLKFFTATNTYLFPEIFICRLNKAVKN